jgi:hypothetical protein
VIEQTKSMRVEIMDTRERSMGMATGNDLPEALFKEHRVQRGRACHRCGSQDTTTVYDDRHHKPDSPTTRALRSLPINYWISLAVVIWSCLLIEYLGDIRIPAIIVYPSIIYFVALPIVLVLGRRFFPKIIRPRFHGDFSTFSCRGCGEELACA